MGTATGIGGGDYRVTPSILKELAAKGMNAKAAETLSRTVYRVEPRQLPRAREAGVDPGFLAELQQRHSGQSFDGRRAFERALKRLEARPRSVRALKQAAAHFELSIVNRSFGTPEALVAAISGTGITLAEKDRSALVAASYTGWTWTADNFRRMLGSKDTATVFVNTILYVFFTLILFNTGFALVLAITTFYLPKVQANVIRMIWFLPRISPPVLYVLLWKWLAWDTGFLSAVLVAFGIDARNWMLDTSVNAWVFRRPDQRGSSARPWA